MKKRTLLGAVVLAAGLVLSPLAIAPATAKPAAGIGVTCSPNVTTRTNGTSCSGVFSVASAVGNSPTCHYSFGDGSSTNRTGTNTNCPSVFHAYSKVNLKGYTVTITASSNSNSISGSTKVIVTA